MAERAQDLISATRDVDAVYHPTKDHTLLLGASAHCARRICRGLASARLGSDQPVVVIFGEAALACLTFTLYGALAMSHGRLIQKTPELERSIGSRRVLSNRQEGPLPVSLLDTAERARLSSTEKEGVAASLAIWLSIGHTAPALCTSHFCSKRYHFRWIRVLALPVESSHTTPSTCIMLQPWKLE